MARYFFHIRTDGDLDRDEFGVELADLDAVRTEALRTIAGFMLDAAITGAAMPGEAFEIADAQGKALIMIPFDAGLGRKGH